MYTMGWLRLVGSLKSQVSFVEYSLFYRALLQKRTISFRSLLIVLTVATPYMYLKCIHLIKKSSVLYHQKKMWIFRWRIWLRWVIDSCGCYGVASVCKLDKIISLFCRILSLLQGSFAKETYNLIDSTNRSRPIYIFYMYFKCVHLIK